MYEDKEVTYKFGINWKDLLIKIILLILFIVLLLWLFPRPQLDTFYDRVFNENIQTMKEAAKSYYTVDKLPKNIGESSSMTLKEMLDKHMVIEFVDKDNKACSTSDSYVQVTKTGDNEYVLKVNLSCDGKSDYILETIGCYDLCPDGSCVTEVPQPEQPIVDTALEYQFKQAVPSNVTTYSCPSGYTRNGNKCYKSGSTNTINATANYYQDSVGVEYAKVNSSGSYVVYADPLTKPGALTCPDGYTSDGTNCYKQYTASAGTTSGQYTCPTGYTLSGTVCYKVYSAKYTQRKTTYTCPSGYTLSGKTCYKTYKATYNPGGTSYYCPNGGTLSGTNCIYAASKGSGSTTYTCPNGGTLSGTRCIKYEYTNATAKVTYGNWYVATTYTQPTARATYANETEKLVYTGLTYKYPCNTPSSCPTKIAYYNYVLYKRSKNTTYTCSSGTVEGSKCKIDKSYNATPVTSGGGYYCPNGGTLSGTNCVYAASKKTGSGSYSCPNGGTLNGTNCVITKAATKSSTTGSYSCPDGGTLNGTTCKLTVNATKGDGSTVLTCPFGGTLTGNKCTTYTEGSRATEYYCPEGYTASGSGASTKCSKKVSGGNNTYYCEDANAVLKGDKCYVTIKGGISGYSCPAGYKLNGKKCIKTDTITIDATASTTTTTSYKYKWSTSPTLDGWTPTGKTRTVQVGSLK